MRIRLDGNGFPAAGDHVGDEFAPESVAADEVVRVRVLPTWLRIDARFGTVYRRRGAPRSCVLRLAHVERSGVGRASGLVVSQPGRGVRRQLAVDQRTRDQHVTVGQRDRRRRPR